MLVFKLLCILSFYVTIDVFRLTYHLVSYLLLFHLFLILLLLSYILSIYLYDHSILSTQSAYYLPFNFFPIDVLRFIFLISHILCSHNIVLLHI